MSEPLHPTCVETTGYAEIAAGTRSYMCSVDCPRGEVGVPVCPVGGDRCSTCRIGGGNGTGGQCARLVPRPAGPDAARDARVAKRRAEDRAKATSALNRLIGEVATDRCDCLGCGCCPQMDEVRRLMHYYLAAPDESGE
jgi:hypothetical protein